jgi:UTP--glucose-1-phosphate uridylyltransferase
MASKGNPHGLALAREKMRQAGVDEVAIDTFAHYYRLLEHGETGMIAEDSIEPLDMESIADVDVPDDVAAEAIRATAVIKLNGGLGTSMGMDRAKSLLCVRRGLSFLDIIARQVLHLRQQYDAPLPLMFMNSFRTSDDTMAALARLQEAGYRYVFVSNSDNLGAVPDARVAGWFAQSGAPFAIEAVRRTPSDRKGGHFARRKADGRIVLRESAQTLDADKAALSDLERHRYCSTNNLWFDIQAMVEALDARGGILGLPLIRNVKHLDPADSSTPEVIQIETAMGAAIEVFEGARTIEVGRDRFVPVKTTDDLLVLRSDVYDIGKDFVLDQAGDDVPYVSLDGDFYKLVGDFDKRFPDGAPSLREADSFTVDGDWTFGQGVRVVGDVKLHASAAQRVEPGAVLSDQDPAQDAAGGPDQGPDQGSTQGTDG